MPGIALRGMRPRAARGLASLGLRTSDNCAALCCWIEWRCIGKSLCRRSGATEFPGVCARVVSTINDRIIWIVGVNERGHGTADCYSDAVENIDRVGRNDFLYAVTAKGDVCHKADLPVTAAGVKLQQRIGTNATAADC